MISKFFQIVAILLCFGLGQQLLADSEDFTDPSIYNGGAKPTNWELQYSQGAAYVSLSSPQESTPGLRVNFYNATKENMLRCTRSITDIACDTVLAKVQVYVSPSDAKVDTFQIVVSTNDWASYERVGDLVYFEDSQRTLAGWETISRQLTIPGLAAQNCELKFGFLFIPAGKSKNYGYISSFEISIAASAQPNNICLKRDGVVVTEFLPGDTDVTVSATVSPSPNDNRLELEGVYSVIDRLGVFTTNKLERIGESNQYEATVNFASPVDAGERIKISAFSKYKVSESLPTVSEPVDGYVYEESNPISPYTVGKLGSVWINELSSEYLEVCGTTNRVVTGGWSLVVYEDSTNEVCRAELGQKFDFTTNMINKVVGLDVRQLNWIGGELPKDSKEYLVSLKNSSDVAEHEVYVSFNDDKVMGMKGYAKWNDELEYGYDWTGTSTSGIFSWSDDIDASPGGVNDGQGFNVPVMGVLSVNTVDANGLNISNVTVVATVSDISNETQLGITTRFEEVSIDGYSIFTIDGVSPNPNKINVVLSGALFGLTAEEKNLVLTNGTSLTTKLAFYPSVGYEDFDDLSKWRNENTKLNWDIYAVTRDGRSENALRLNTYNITQGEGELVCNNALSSRGRKVAYIEFDYRNTVNDYDPYDEFAVLISTNKNFAGTVVSTRSLSNKRAEYGNNMWYRYQSAIEMDDDFCNMPELWVKLYCVSQFKTHSYTFVDNLRIAFQDMATVDGLRRIGTEKEPSFEIDVKPWCGEGQSVSNVTAQLVMNVNGKVFTNEVAAVNLAEDKPFTISNKIIRANLRANVGYEQLRAHDKVKYWAQVKYYADSRDPDPAKEWETKFYPDNSKVDSEGRWTVEGEYGVDMAKVESENTFTVSGGPITLNGDINAGDITADFNCRLYDAAGVSNVTVKVYADGQSEPVYTFETNAVENVTHFDILVTVPGLTENTKYTVKVSGLNAKGEEIAEQVFDPFWTKPKAPTARIEAVSQTEATLIVTGDAAEFVVPAGWAKGAGNTWTKGGFNPNTLVEAKGISAKNAKDGESAKVDAQPAYTWAAAAIEAPVIERVGTTVQVSAAEAYVESGDGNPEGTLYAILVKTDSDKEGIVATNGTDEVWQTLEAWRSTPMTLTEPTINLSETNYFSFVTRNFDEDPILTESEVATNCWFDMEAWFDGEPQQIRDGMVKFSLKFFDPANAESATAEVEYKIGDDEWVSCGELAVEFNERNASIEDIEWDAWTAAGQASGYYNYKLRVRVNSGNRSSKWMEAGGELDFVAPEGLTLNGTPEANAIINNKNIDFAASATDKEGIVYRWTFNGAEAAEVTEGAFSATANEGENEISVYAEDIFGNKSEPLTRSWTVDTIKPENLKITGTPAYGAETKEAAVQLTATATDATALKYLWKFNGSESEGAALKATAREGENSASVIAIDAAGNESEPVEWIWELDTTKPEITSFNGNRKEGEITSDKGFNFTVESEDANGVSYEWTLNGVEQSEKGATFAGEVSTDGKYTVAVTAVDVAGNRSDSVSVSWTLDTTKPVITKFDGNRTAGEKTKDKEFRFSVEATDENTVSYIWKLNGDVQPATGTTFTGEVSADGDYTVTVVAVDAAKNQSEARSISWELDTTKPEITKFEGNRTAGEKTNVKEFSFMVEATDKNTVSYIWTLNGDVQPATGTTFTGEVSADGDCTVTVVAVDAAKNQSEARSISWELDTTKPEITKFEGNRTAGEKTNVKEFCFTVEATDKNTVSYIWKLNDVEQAETGATFAGEVSTDGDYTVTVVAVDAANNQSEERTLGWELDTTKPEIVKFEGNRTAGEKTNDKEFSFTVEATDKNTISYVWKLNDVEQMETGATFTGEVSADGDYVVSVVAIDAANNQSEERSLSWELDTTKPEIVKFEGNRTAGETTNDKEFGFTVEATDKNTVSYIWKLNDVVQSATGTTFTGEVSADGDYTVTVVAVDAANNHSEERSLSWTLDTTKPEIVKFEGNRTDGEKTNDKEFSFTVEATDENTVSYIWKLNGAVQAESSATFSGEVSADGDYVVSVVAIDAANNQSEERTLSWEFDTTKPEITKFEGTRTVGEKTNEKSFSFTVEATDKNTVSYIWKLNDAVQSATGTTFTGEVSADGDYTVTVVAVDAAKNQSEARSISWELDTTKPEIVKFEGNRTAGEKTNDKSFSFTVEATDKNTVSYIWTLNGAVQTVTGATFAGEVAADGDYTVSVVAVDAAKNKSDALSLNWELDTTKPEIVKFEGNRTAGEKTNDKTFSFTVEATDKNTVSYIWKLNGDVQSATGTTFTGEVSEDGDYTVTVVAVDAAKNKSEGRSISWELDTTKPEIVKFEGNRTAGEKTNDKTFSFTVEATDKNTVSYIWKLNDVVQSETGATFTGEVSEDGDYTVTVVAVDAAENESESRFVGWEYDSTKPTVELTCSNEIGEGGKFLCSKLKPMIVTAKFSENVDGFAIEDVSTVNGIVSDLSGSGDTYTFKVTPEKADEVRVNIAAGVVVDDAKNENTQSNELVGEFTDDVKPAISLMSEAPERINAAYGSIKVEIRFSEHINGFDTGDIVAGSANVELEVLDENENTYIATITPTKDEKMSVVVPAGVLTDDAGNENTESNILEYECDITAPTVELTSSTPQYFNEERNPLVVTVTFSELVEGFSKDSVTVENGSVANVNALVENQVFELSISPKADGEVRVVVLDGCVVDKFENSLEASSSITRVRDTVAPTKPVISEPGSGKKKLLTAISEDASPVTYHWTFKDITFTGLPFYISTSTDTLYVKCFAKDAAGNESGVSSKRWTINSDKVFGTDFGDDVWMPPAGTYDVPDEITFTASSINPGSDSKLTFRGLYSLRESLTALNMYLVVSETLDGPTWKVPVNNSATYNLETGELTVTLPSDEMLDEKGNAYQSFFIRGISNTKR